MSKRPKTTPKAAAKTVQTAAKATSKAKLGHPTRPAPATAKKPVSSKPTAKKAVAGKKTTGLPGKSAAAAKSAIVKAGKSLKKAVKPAAKAGKAAITKVVKPAVQRAAKAVKPAVKAAEPEAVKQQADSGIKTAAKLVNSVRKIATELVKPAVKAATELVETAVHAATKPAAAAVPLSRPAPPSKPAATGKAGKKAVSVVQVISDPIAPAKPPVISSEIPVSAKSGALYYDSHMHTPLCKHAIGEPEEYAQQGIKAGLKGIIFTCHCPMPDGYWPTVRMTDSEFDTYVSIVQRAARAFKGKIDVCLGLESEFFPGHEKWIENLHKRADFDFILGGLHWQSKDYLGRFETGTIENFRRSYFEHLAQSAETGLYDCLAHPDLVKNYHPDSWCFAIVKNTTAGALDRIAKTGVAMEINTSGLNKSYSEMNPGLEMLRMMADRKIPIVIGSDAHKPSRVGEHFVTALNHLTEVGYEQVSYFKRRERIDLKISEVLASIKKAADANA